MSTWEQRMAQRKYVRTLVSDRRDGEEYQRARLYAMQRVAAHARGPQPHNLAKCCWRNKWLGDVWGVERLCGKWSPVPVYTLDVRSPCDHQHHETEGPWMAAA